MTSVSLRWGGGGGGGGDKFLAQSVDPDFMSHPICSNKSYQRSNAFLQNSCIEFCMRLIFPSS